MGSINLASGHGQVTIDNQTGIPLVVQDVDAGSQSLGGQAFDRIDITDTFQPAGSQQTLYLYDPGQGIAVYKGPAGATLGTGTPYETIAGNRPPTAPRPACAGSGSSRQACSAPDPGGRVGPARRAGVRRRVVHLRLEWIARPGRTAPVAYVSPVDGTLSTTAVGQVVVDGGLPVFQETITASSSNSFTWNITYHDGHYGFADDGGSSVWHYHYPDRATITLTSSVKADNPIGISFSGSAGSSRSPRTPRSSSTARSRTRTVAPPSTPRGASPRPPAPLVSDNLTLDATGGIGTASSPIDATLAAGGVLNAQAGPEGVYLGSVLEPCQPGFRG